MKSSTNVAKESNLKITSAVRARQRKVKIASARKYKQAKSRLRPIGPIASDYSESAQHLLRRGKEVAVGAAAWLGETGTNIAQSAHKVRMRDASSVKNFVGDQPLILGAVGVGLGLILGTILPSIRGEAIIPTRARRR